MWLVCISLLQRHDDHQALCILMYFVWLYFSLCTLPVLPKMGDTISYSPECEYTERREVKVRDATGRVSDFDAQRIRVPSCT